MIFLTIIVPIWNRRQGYIGGTVVFVPAAMNTSLWSPAETMLRHWFTVKDLIAKQGTPWNTPANICASLQRTGASESRNVLPAPHKVQFLGYIKSPHGFSCMFWGVTETTNCYRVMRTNIVFAPLRWKASLYTALVDICKYKQLNEFNTRSIMVPKMNSNLQQSKVYK